MIYVNNHTKNFLDAISAINKDDSNINPTYETDKKSINPNKPKKSTHPFSTKSNNFPRINAKHDINIF